MVSFSQKVSFTSGVLQQYQSMVEDAVSDLDDQAKGTIIADTLLHHASITQNLVFTQNKRSIERCLYICNRALEFTMTSDFHVNKRHPTAISSINELLPEERRGFAMLLDRIRQLSDS